MTVKEKNRKALSQQLELITFLTNDIPFSKDVIEKIKLFLNKGTLYQSNNTIYGSMNYGKKKIYMRIGPAYINNQLVYMIKYYDNKDEKNEEIEFKLGNSLSIERSLITNGILHESTIIAYDRQANLKEFSTITIDMALGLESVKTQRFDDDFVITYLEDNYNNNPFNYVNEFIVNKKDGSFLMKISESDYNSYISGDLTINEIITAKNWQKKKNR